MIESDVLILLAITTGFTAIACLSIVFTMQLRKTQLRISSLEGELSQYKQQLKALNKGTVGVGRHLSALEKRLLSGLNKAEKQGIQEMSMLSFGDANRLVEQGVDADVLVKRCGMSRAEAELLCKLRSA